jgi:hypothetical protein
MRPVVAAPARVKPLAPERFALQVTIPQATCDRLRRAQELLSPKLPSGDVAQVLDLALQALVAQLEKRKLAATAKPRKQAKASQPDSRHIPAAVKRAVRERDGDQCTFMSPDGRRCPERKFLEFDHVTEYARGGRAMTASDVRQRCRAHNLHGAERTFGREFMQRKQDSARGTRAAARAEAEWAEREARDEREAAERARVQWERDRANPSLVRTEARG